MPEDLKEKLGISQDINSPNKSGVTQSMNMKLTKKQSILKKSSLMMSQSRKSSIRESGTEFQSMNLKSKKSVMFNCTL